MIQVPLGSVRIDVDQVTYPADLVEYVKSEYGDSDPSWLLRAIKDNGRAGH